MSDSKEVKRWTLNWPQKISVTCTGGDALQSGSTVVLASDHDRIVAEAKADREFRIDKAYLELIGTIEELRAELTEAKAEVETKRNEQIKVISDLSEQLTKARAEVEVAKFLCCGGNDDSIEGNGLPKKHTMDCPEFEDHHADLTQLRETITELRAEVEQWKVRYQKLKKVYSPDEDDFALRALEKEGEKDND